MPSSQGCLTMENSKREKVTLDEATEHTICEKALVMYKLLEGYSRYFDMLSNRTFALNQLTYQEAEELSELLHDFMGIDYPTEDLLWNTDECSNAAIEDYHRLQKLLNQRLTKVSAMQPWLSINIFIITSCLFILEWEGLTFTH